MLSHWKWNIDFTFFVFFSEHFSAYPDVEVHDVHDGWDFVLLASDGIWDVLSNDDVVKMCLKKMERGLPPEEICEEIMTECLSPDLLMTGTDNMTIVLICFLHNKSYEDFCKRAADYCQRLFPDDEKFQQDKLADSKSAANCEQNGIDEDDSGEEEDVDEDEEDEDEMQDANEQNGDENGTSESNSNEANGQIEADAKKSQDDVTQESKKFKEIDDETEPKWT